MNIIKKIIFVGVFVFTPLTAFSSSLTSLVLFYDETEEGTGTQSMRYLINDHFLRIDEGNINSDYILYDRAKKTVYSVNHGDQTILKITSKVWHSPDYDFAVSIEERALLDAPKVFGKQVFNYQVKAKDEVCTNVLMVKGIHAKEMDVLQEYQVVMSGQQAASLNNTPVEMHTPCYLVDQVFHKAEYLKLGLPIQISYSRGYAKLLKNIEVKDIREELFLLPDGYKEFLPFTQ